MEIVVFTPGWAKSMRKVARYYDPDRGRFISEDPIGDGLNWYVYGNNNPVMFKDPTGMWADGDEKRPAWVQKIIIQQTIAWSSPFGPRGPEAARSKARAIAEDARRRGEKYGAARSYVSVTSGSVNCYGYALGRNYGSDPLMAPSNNVNLIANSVINELNQIGENSDTTYLPEGTAIGARLLSGIDAEIGADEYRIAVRVGTELVDTLGNGTLVYDYHFMVQHNDGTWSHKPGQNNSVQLKAGQTPENVQWVNDQGYVYDSEIVYIAVQVR